MINTSTAYRKALECNREFRVRDEITFQNGATMRLSISDFMEYSISEATSDSGKFQIGAAVIKEYSATLNNEDGKFDSYNFEGADLKSIIGLRLADGSWEDLDKGLYRIVSAKASELTIKITAYDSMLFFDKPYKESKLSYPATITEIVRNACMDCQVTFDASTVEMGSYRIEKRPDDESLTYRDVISYCAQIMGRYAKIDHWDKLAFGWYTFDSSEKDLSGGAFVKQESQGNPRNLLHGSGESVWSSEYFIRGFTADELTPGETYTLVINAKASRRNSYIGVYSSNAKIALTNFKNGQNGIQRVTFTVPEEVPDTVIRFWDMGANQEYNAVVYWACLYKGDIDGPMKWIPADEELQYEVGNAADGGNFVNYRSGDACDAGTFNDMKDIHHLYRIAAQSINTDDISITGIKVCSKGESEENTESVLHGEEGYVLEISDNPLIQSGAVKEVADHIGGKITGNTFRPLSISCQSDPSMEAGDTAYVTDRKQRTYKTVITNTTFGLGSVQKVECTAETPTEKNYAKYSATTKFMDEAKKQTNQQLSTYDIAVQNMNQLAANTFGFYATTIKHDNGSIIAYRHDKPDLSESKVVYKSGIDGFFVTTDYQGSDEATTVARKWKAGFDSGGDATLNILNAIGINADWINAGAISAERIKGGTLEGVKIIGETGTIGGFMITKTKIYGGDKSIGIVGLQAPSSGNTWAIFAGADDAGSPGSAPFRVSRKGKLYAADATIEGTLKSNNVRILDDKIEMYNSGTLICRLVYEKDAKVYIGNKDGYESNGIKDLFSLRASDCLCLKATEIYVEKNSSAYRGFSGSIKFWDGEDPVSSLWHLQFVNGICTYAGTTS